MGQASSPHPIQHTTPTERSTRWGRSSPAKTSSLDGVVEDPTGEEGSHQGGWFNQFMGEDREAWAAVELSEAQRAEAC